MSDAVRFDGVLCAQNIVCRIIEANRRMFVDSVAAEKNTIPQLIIRVGVTGFVASWCLFKFTSEKVGLELWQEVLQSSWSQQ